jgi:peptide deformylase
VSVSRPSHVVVRALNLDGDLMQYEADGNLFATCLQHEIDHLQGITMVDHLRPLERVKALRAMEEAMAAGAVPGDVSVE